MLSAELGLNCFKKKIDFEAAETAFCFSVNSSGISTSDYDRSTGVYLEGRVVQAESGLKHSTQQAQGICVLE